MSDRAETVRVVAKFTRGALKALDLPYEEAQKMLDGPKVSPETRRRLQAEMDQLAWLRACALMYQEAGVFDEVVAYLKDGGGSEVAAAA